MILKNEIENQKGKKEGKKEEMRDFDITTHHSDLFHFCFIQFNILHFKFLLCASEIKKKKIKRANKKKTYQITVNCIRVFFKSFYLVIEV